MVHILHFAAAGKQFDLPPGGGHFSGPARHVGDDGGDSGWQHYRRGGHAGKRPPGIGALFPVAGEGLSEFAHPSGSRWEVEAPGAIIGTGFLRKEGERREKGFTVFVPSGGHRRCVYRHPGADLSGDHLAVQQLFRVFLCFLHSAQRVGSSVDHQQPQQPCV